MSETSRSIRVAVAATYLGIVALWEVVGRATFDSPSSLFPPPSEIFSFIWDTRSGLLDAAAPHAL